MKAVKLFSPKKHEINWQMQSIISGNHVVEPVLKPCCISKLKPSQTSKAIEPQPKLLLSFHKKVTAVKRIRLISQQ
jgi:hypothetical protein